MVTSYVELLIDYFHDQGIEIDTKREKYIFYITDAVKRMRKMIKDVLNFSRVGRNTEIEEIALVDIIDTVKNNLQEKIHETKAIIKITGDLPRINTRKTELIQLFQNLLSNAMKFVREGTIPEIEIKVEQVSNDEWKFMVKDNGIGINPEFFEKIFLIFQRLEGKNRYQGTGIGLTLCKKIIEQHQGRIWLESQEAKGTSFYFTLKDLSDNNKPNIEEQFYTQTN